MAITLVGQAGVAGGTPGGSNPITYSSTAGNLLVVTGHLFASSGQPLLTGITDTAGNTWHFSTTPAQNPPLAENSTGANFQTDFTAWSIAAAHVTSVTVGLSVAAFWRVALSEFSGVNAFGNSWSGTAASGSTFTLGPVTVPSAGSLVTGVASCNSGSETVPSGWTAFTAAGANLAGYIINPATGSYSPQWSTTVSDIWSAAIAVFTPPSTSHSGSATRAITAGRTAAVNATHVRGATLTVTAARTAAPPVQGFSLNAIPGRMVPGQTQPGNPVATVTRLIHPPGAITVTATITAAAVAGTAAGTVRTVAATVTAKATVTRHRAAARTVTATVTALKVGTHHRSVTRATTVTAAPGAAKPGNTHSGGTRPTWTATLATAAGATRHRATGRTATWNATAAAVTVHHRSESRTVTATITAHAVVPGGNRTAARPVTATVTARPAHSGSRTARTLTVTVTVTARAGKTSPQVVLGPVVTPYTTSTADVEPQAD